MKTTTVTSAKSVALQHLAPDDLHDQLQDSLELSILGRKMSAEIRIRLFPMLQEVKRRYNSGETINRVEGYHEYLRSIGLNPSTVRTWELRHKRLEGIPEGSILSDLDDPDHFELPDDSYVEEQSEKYEQKLQHDIEFAAAIAEEDPESKKQREKNLHDFINEARAKTKQRSPFADYRAPGRTPGTAAGIILPVRQPSSTDIQEFISLGRRAAANKYHPDKGGSTERMAQMNQVADWLEKLVEGNV